VDGRDAIADLRETAAVIKDGSSRITTKVETGVDDVAAKFDEINRRLAPALDSLAGLTANLNRASLDLAEGRGTAGKLLRDDRLYEKLVLFTDNLNELVDTLRRIADKTERQGYLDIAAHKESPLGPVPVRKDLYDAGGVPAAH
jgi:hypothetical protein